MRNRFLGLAALTLLVTTLAGTDTATARARSAKATLRTAYGNRIGTVRFQTVGGHTEVRVTLNSGGLTDVEVDVFHGFHIHANGDDSATPGNGSGCIADRLRHGRRGSRRPTATTTRPDRPTPTTSATCRRSTSTPTAASRRGSGSTRSSPVTSIGKAVVLHVGPDNFANIPVGDGRDAVHRELRRRQRADGEDRQRGGSNCVRRHHALTGDASAGRPLRRRRCAVIVVAGVAVGVVVVGIGSRMAMFVLRLTSPDRVRGVVSDEGSRSDGSRSRAPTTSS